MLAAVGGEFPVVGIEDGVGAHGEVEIFGVGAEVAVNHGSDHAEEVATVVVNRAAAVAGADGSGHLQGVVVGARDDAGAEREAQALGMPDDVNVFAFADLFFGLDGLHEFAVTGFARQPDQAEIEIFVAGDDVGAGPGAGGHGDERAGAAALEGGFVNDVPRGDEKVAFGSGFKKDAGAEAVGGNFIVVEPGAPPGRDDGDERLQLFGNFLGGHRKGRGQRGEDAFGVEFAEALADDGGEGNEGDGQDGGDGGEDAADDHQGGEIGKPGKAGARREAAHGHAHDQRDDAQDGQNENQRD